MIRIPRIVASSHRRTSLAGWTMRPRRLQVGHRHPFLYGLTARGSSLSLFLNSKSLIFNAFRRSILLNSFELVTGLTCSICGFGKPHDVSANRNNSSDLGPPARSARVALGRQACRPKSLADKPSASVGATCARAKAMPFGWPSGGLRPALTRSHVGKATPLERAPNDPKFPLA